MNLDIALILLISSMAIGTLAWWMLVLRRHRRTAAEECRANIRSLRTTTSAATTAWGAGSDCDSKFSGRHQAVAWLAIGAVGDGCGGGCGCGG